MNNKGIDMELTSKQRAQLKGIASSTDTIMQIGKEGITDNVVASAADMLRARELIKVKVLESCMLTPAEACEELASDCDAVPVQVIGTKFVLYKRNNKNPKIQLIKDRKPK